MKEQRKNTNIPKERRANLNANSFVNTPLGELPLHSVENIEAPANDDAYFNFRSPPNDWVLAVRGVSRPHLFKHAVCIAQVDDKLREYINNKVLVARLSEDEKVPSPIQDAITSWLLGRPTFYLARVDRRRSFYQWNAWDKDTHRALMEMARECGVSAALLFIIYSTKSLATRAVVSPHVEKLLKKVVSEWDRWLCQENEDFSEILATFTH